MASFFTLNLDTIGPQDPSLLIAGSASGGFVAAQLANCTLSTSDASAAGYQVKIWGDVDTTENANIQDTEENALWFTPTWDVNSATQQVKLSTVDGLKTLSLKIKDTVDNASSTATATITLDTVAPQAEVTSGPNATVISKQTGKRTATFSFQSGETFQAYKVMVVTNGTDAHTAGTLVPGTNGSTTSGSAGNYAANTPIDVSIDAADLELAGAEGANIVKVFVQDLAGTWSAA